LSLIELLELRGFDRRGRTKLVRHRDSRYDMHELARHGWFEAYQAFQSRPIFKGCDRIVSFIGLDGSRARLAGVYRVGACRSAVEAPLPAGCPHHEWRKAAHFYELTRESGYQDLEDRVIIDWGPGALAWHQRLRDKEVIELVPRGQLKAPFRDYLEFTLTYSELIDLFHAPEANREWRARLSGVAGVYLILATTTGEQYVGSAHGAEGIWGRWAAYAETGHGGNELLKKLLREDPAYPEAFVFSVLQVLPRSLARQDVIGWEGQYKLKLGTRATGLNSN
jgi:hypothetical protein